MFRICLLAAALLLTGCSKADPFPIKIGTEAFLTYDALWDLSHPPAGQTPVFVTKGTKVRNRRCSLLGGPLEVRGPGARGRAHRPDSDGQKKPGNLRTLTHATHDANEPGAEGCQARCVRGCGLFSLLGYDGGRHPKHTELGAAQHGRRACQ